MKILITGGAGFVGSHLCDSLISKGHEIVIFTRNMQKNQNISHILDKITIENVDVTSWAFNRMKGQFTTENFFKVFKLKNNELNANRI